MKAFLVNGKERKSLNEKLADTLAIVFIPASARATVSGEFRDAAALAIAGIIPQLGKFESFVLELEDSEKTVITVKNENLVNVLGKIADAYKIMESAREQTESHNSAYDLIRMVEKLAPAEKGKRGRPSQNPESRYSNLLG